MKSLSFGTNLKLLTLFALVGLSLISSSPAKSATPQDPVQPFYHLTPDEKKILSIHKSVMKDKIDNFDLIRKTAQPSPELLIYRCAVRPVVISLSTGQLLTFKNIDNTPHIIESDRQHEFLVPAKGTLTANIDLGHGRGIYSIECDRSGKLSGIFFFGF